MTVHDLDPARVHGHVVHRGARCDVHVHLWRDGREPEGRIEGADEMPPGTALRVWLGDGRSALVVVVGADNRFLGAEPFSAPPLN